MGEITIDSRPATARVLDAAQAGETLTLVPQGLGKFRTAGQPRFDVMSAVGVGDTVCLHWDEGTATLMRRAEKQSWVRVGLKGDGGPAVPVSQDLARTIRGASTEWTTGMCPSGVSGCFSVGSASVTDVAYHTMPDAGRCTCADHVHRGVVCKHVRALWLRAGGRPLWAQGLAADARLPVTTVQQTDAYRPLGEHWSRLTDRPPFTGEDGRPAWDRGDLPDGRRWDLIDDHQVKGRYLGRVYLTNGELDYDEVIPEMSRFGEWLARLTVDAVCREDEKQEIEAEVAMMRWDAETEPRAIVRWLRAFREEGMTVQVRVKEDGRVLLVETD